MCNLDALRLASIWLVEFTLQLMVRLSIWLSNYCYAVVIFFLLVQTLVTVLVK